MVTFLPAHHDDSWGEGPLSVAPHLPPVAVLALAAVWFRRRGGPSRQLSTGRSMLDERYARGDMFADEYRERLPVLKEDQR
jgi:hypothetical protein